MSNQIYTLNNMRFSTMQNFQQTTNNFIHTLTPSVDLNSISNIRIFNPTLIHEFGYHFKLISKGEGAYVNKFIHQTIQELKQFVKQTSNNLNNVDVRCIYYMSNDCNFQSGTSKRQYVATSKRKMKILKQGHYLTTIFFCFSQWIPMRISLSMTLASTLGSSLLE